MHAESLARRLQEGAPDDPARIALAYSLLFQRPPNTAEKETGLTYLAQEGDRNKHWKHYAQVLLGTHEFMQME